MNIDYQLDRMGWSNFQHLCGNILRECLGQTYQTFSDGNDAGQDGAYLGTWKRNSSEKLTGSFIVQCKHTSKRDGRFSLAILNHEIAKVERLAQRGFCRNYLILTNYSITADNARKVQQIFENIPGVERCLIFDKSWIQNCIHCSRELRALVPRLYGLGDLSQILDERAYAQAQAILNHLGDDFSCFVPTTSHSDSVRAMNQNGFVFLLGEPCCGKSTIALALALASVDSWGCNLIKVDNAAYFRDHWNPSDQKQFFWVDDAFGTTQYERELALEWNRQFPALASAIKKGSKVVFTSRDYIYKAAIEDLKESAFPLIKDSRVVINVEDISEPERAQILYNHIKLGKQPREFKLALRKHLPLIASHKRFLPETARRLGDPFFTEHVQLNRDSLEQFVSDMKGFLIDNIRNFGSTNRAAVALVFMRKGKLHTELHLTEKEKNALTLLGATLGEVRSALGSLSPTLLLATENNGERYWSFKHPSVRDAFGTYIADDPSLTSIYLENTSVKTLLSEIACGITDIEGVKLNVPEKLFPIVLDRLSELRLTVENERDMLVQFLRNKVGDRFLTMFALSHPRFHLHLDYRPWMRYCNATNLAARLFALGLLPEVARAKLAKKISSAAVYSCDASCYSVAAIGAILSDPEHKELSRNLRSNLMSHLRFTITRAKKECISAKSDSSGELWETRTDIRQYSRHFRNNRSLHHRLHCAEMRVVRIIKQLDSRMLNLHPIVKADSEALDSQKRSVFDDVAD